VGGGGGGGGGGVVWGYRLLTKGVGGGGGLKIQAALGELKRKIASDRGEKGD